MVDQVNTIPIDLSDPDAWDDSALIRAYDAAIDSYQVCLRAPSARPPHLTA